MKGDTRMKLLTPLDIRSANFKNLYCLYESKKIGFVGLNFVTFQTVWLPIEYENGKQQIRMLDDRKRLIEAASVMALWQDNFSENLYLFSDIVDYIRKQEGYYDDLPRFNFALCEKCGGKCCKRTGCYYSPKDFKEISFEILFKHLCKGYTSIYPINGFYTGLSDSLILKIRNVGEPVAIDKDYGYNQCILLGEKGCSLSREKRPRGGRELIPLENGCITGYTFREIVEEWAPYQLLLLHLYNIFYGKDIPFKGVI